MITAVLLIAVVAALLLYDAFIDYSTIDRKIEDEIDRIIAETPEGVEPDFSRVWDEIINGGKDD